MRRINVHGVGPDGRRTLVGWFDLDRATIIKERTRWDGRRHVSVHTADRFDHQDLYRTRGGRWVLHSWSEWAGREETYEYISDERAREWLLLNEDDDLVETHFGAIEEERGPGRPEVGRPINWRPGDALLARIDELAEQRGQSRAETLRYLVETHPDMS